VIFYNYCTIAEISSLTR